MTVQWRGKPIWVLHRTQAILERLKAPALRNRLRDPDSAVETQQPPYVVRQYRSIKPEFLVVVGLCTHLGCVPTFRPEVGPPDLGADWPGGYFLFLPWFAVRFDRPRVQRGARADQPAGAKTPLHSRPAD